MESENSFKKRPFFYVFLVLLIALGLLMISVAVLMTDDTDLETNKQNKNTISGINLPAGWVFSLTDTGESYSYPPQLDTKYISARNWSPTLVVANEPFSCTPAGDEFAPGIWTVAREIDGRSYCVSTYTEGAAGTIYKNYSYYFSLDGQTAALSFFLGYPQCGNYDDQQRVACEQEQAEFSVDDLVAQIVKTVTPTQTTTKDRLSTCLVASDWASHDYCVELLQGIINYDECVAAGLKVSETDPNLCLTPDGRSLKNEANSTWPLALEAINNCKVSQILQNHQEFVQLELKDGSIISAYEPDLDDAFLAANAVTEQCGIVRMGTE